MPGWYEGKYVEEVPEPLPVVSAAIPRIERNVLLAARRVIYLLGLGLVCSTCAVCDSVGVLPVHLFCALPALIVPTHVCIHEV